MSDSRLEKFIYAICSMDVSDLPVPLSRIEKLWNCLITGETPDFEPLSRNEKYLMAMLDRYDISNLPAPMSRGEKLLYKIAVGETDLSDVPGYLSRYEELLKYLIENSEISEDDFEYVLYTLNQSLHTLYLTAEKPVKSAILKGQTLVNLSKVSSHDFAQGRTPIYDLAQPMKANTTYTIFINVTLTGGSGIFIRFGKNAEGDYTQYRSFPNVGLHKFTVTPDMEYTQFAPYIQLSDYNAGIYGKYDNLVIIEGDYTNVDIPYFEGMQSVKMPVLTTTGKNLFNDKEEIISQAGNKIPTEYDTIEGAYKFSIKDNYKEYKDLGVYKTINMKNGETLIFSGKVKNASNVRIYKNNDFSSTYFANYIPSNPDILSEFELSFQAIEDCLVNCRFWSPNNNTDIYFKDIQIEKNTSKTDYEPYKSNILTVNEEVELRAIGEVQDTLDCLTGELTERIGEIVLDGSKVYYPGGNSNDNYLEFIVRMNNAKRASALCDKVFTPSGGHKNNTEYVRVTESGIIGYILKTRLSTPDVDGLKAWLSSNNVTVQYQLATPITKSIDISTVDQDNQPTQLGTFENITHVSLEAENLIPEVEMEVATNLLEDTVFNLTNAFNTLYPTAEKPVKSATLSGQTLVNIHPTKYSIGVSSSTTFFAGIEINRSLIKPNTKYFLRLYNAHISVMSAYFKPCVTAKLNLLSNNKCAIFTTKGEFSDTDLSYNKIHFYSSESLTKEDVENTKILLCEYQDGMENWDIPYFEGMTSVKMPVLTTVGKNLFNINKCISGKSIDNNGELIDGSSYQYAIEEFIKIDNTITVSVVSDDGVVPDTANGTRLRFYDKSKKLISSNWFSGGIQVQGNRKKRTFTVNGAEYLRLNISASGEVVDTSYEAMKTIQIENGSSMTSYEPYKSNILSTPSDLELRGVGDVRDELDCLTGEVVERIKERVFNGSEKWVQNGQHSDGSYRHICNTYTDAKSSSDYIICDKIGFADVNQTTGAGMTSDINIIKATSTGKLQIATTKTLNELKAWLTQNPITILYELATESIKTVDLTVVDQDNQPTELGTFDDTTHVLLNSEGLIPTAVLTVRTKIPSGSSTSLLMDDISTNQQQLETTVDEQSNNVDATMVATTEIYEETL